MQTSNVLHELVRAIRSDEEGAIGWLTLGIVIGAILIVVLIIKFLIPGE